jgi:hypothetical protein
MHGVLVHLAGSARPVELGLMVGGHRELDDRPELRLPGARHRRVRAVGLGDGGGTGKIRLRRADAV